MTSVPQNKNIENNLLFSKCYLCFRDIDEDLKSFKPKYSLGIVCLKCYNSLAEENIEILVHAFNINRGRYRNQNINGLYIKDVIWYRNGMFCEIIGIYIINSFFIKFFFDEKI